MGFFSSLFGNKEAMPASIEQRTPVEEVQHQIAVGEDELAHAQEQLNMATDVGLKESLQALVTRKAQALADLEEKLRHLQSNQPQQ